MRFDTRTIVLVTKRLVDLAERPPLFHERITPAIIMRRLQRVLDWLGMGGRTIAAEHIKHRTLPAPGKKQGAKGDGAWP